MPAGWLAHRLLLAAALLLTWPAAVHADTFLTNCTAGALRTAVAAGGTVLFGCDGTIALSRPLLIERDVTLDGYGRNVVLRGAQRTTNTQPVRIFHVKPGATLTLRNLTLAGGQATNGGAILNEGQLIAKDCLFTNNVAVGLDGADGSDGASDFNLGGHGGHGASGGRSWGGAVCNLGSASFARCIFVRNHVFGGDGGRGGHGGSGAVQGGHGGHGGHGGNGLGGAIYSRGTLRVTDSFFEDNAAVGGNPGRGGTNGTGIFPSYAGHGGAGGVASGGAIHLLGQAWLNRCTFARNDAFSADSANAGTTATLFDGRRGADSYGGAVCNRGTAVVINCTFYANTAVAGYGGTGANSAFQGGDGGDGGNAWGGNFFNGHVSLVTNCTFASGAAFPGLGGAAGAGPLPGEAGALGASRGGNLANSGPLFLLRGTILSSPPGATNVVVETNVTTLYTNVPTNVVAVSTPIFALTNFTCLMLPIDTNSCFTDVVFQVYDGSRLVPVSTNTYVRTNPYCTRAVWPNPCLVQLQLTNLLATNLAVPFFVTNVVTSTNIVQGVNAYGAFLDAGRNLSSDGTPAFTKPGSRNHLDPRLGPFQRQQATDPTPTLALAPDSPARDWIPANYPPVDQRRTPRPVGTRADIGAVEWVNLTPDAGDGPSRTAAAAVLTARLAVFSAGGPARLILQGLPGLTYRIEATTNLTPPIRWETIGEVVTDAAGRIEFTDPSAAQFAARFYRAAAR